MTLAGITESASIMLTNILLSIWQYRSIMEVQELEDSMELTHLATHSLVDVLAGWAFMWIFCYEAFGPNSEYVYIICNLTHEGKVNAVIMIGLNLMINIIKLLVLALAIQCHA